MSDLAPDLEKLLREWPLPEWPARPLRLGVVGLGGVAMRCHLPALAFLRSRGWPVEIVSLCDRDPARVEAASAAHASQAGRFTDARALLAAGGLDAVLLLTWPPLTAELCELAAERGLAVFVEKPVAEESARVAELDARIAGLGARVQVGYNRRHQIGAWAFRAWLATRSELEQVVVRLWRDKRSEPGFYEDTLVHPLDLLLWLFGPLRIETVLGFPPRAGSVLERGLEICFRSEHGVRIALDVRPAVGRTLESVEALAPLETGVLGYSGVEPFTDRAEFSTYQLGRREARYQLSPAQNSHEAMTYARGFIHQMAAFVRYAAGADRESPCSLAEAAARLRLRDDILGRVRS